MRRSKWVTRLRWNNRLPWRRPLAALSETLCIFAIACTKRSYSEIVYAMFLQNLICTQMRRHNSSASDNANVYSFGHD
jgi:hypothetical protein